MNRFYAFTIFLLAIGVADQASAQGLYGLGVSGSEITESSPLKVSVGAEAGYDSNTNTTAEHEVDSFFYGGGVGLFYAYANETTRFDVGGNFSALYYENTLPYQDDIYYNTRLSANLGHRLSQRATLTNNFLFAYEIDPDYLLGASSALRNDHYFFGYNRIGLNFELTRRFSSVTSYAFDGVWYDNRELSQQEDRHTHTFGEQLRYALTRKTTGTLDYRFAYTDFLNIDNDTNSHYLLVGADHEFSAFTRGGISVGAEHRSFEHHKAITRPYGEAWVLYKLTDDTHLRWAGRAGLENNEIGYFRNRYGYRTGLTGMHTFTPTVRGSVGLSYLHSDFDSAGADELDDASDDAVSVNIGVTYRLFRNVDLHGGYHYTTYFSDLPLRDYDRHRATVGISSTF